MFVGGFALLILKIGYGGIPTCKNEMLSSLDCQIRTRLWMRFAFCSPMLEGMGEMRRAIARENEEKQRDRFASTLVIAASIIAAVRLARDDIGTPSPKVMCAVADSVTLATMILKRVLRSSTRIGGP